MGFQGVAFLSSQASSSTTFLENCGRGESLETTTCHKTEVGASTGMLPVKHLPYNKASFASVEFHGDHKTFTKLTTS